MSWLCKNPFVLLLASLGIRRRPVYYMSTKWQPVLELAHKVITLFFVDCRFCWLELCIQKDKTFKQFYTLC
jgi:hypothetical protein